MFFFTGKLFYIGSISIRMQHDDMPFVRQPINKKAGTRPVSRLLVPAFLKAYLLCGVATNLCLARVIDHYSTFIPILVPEHQLAVKGIDEDGLVTTNLFGQYFLAQVVKHIALDGALNGSCTKLWVVAKVG